MSDHAIYVDHAATTPCDPAVAALLHEVLVADWGNPSSRHYAAGRRARARIDEARAAVGAALGAAHDDEIVFTSGATEACNTAILGTVSRLLRSRPRLVTIATEHPAVYEPLQHCAAAGAELITIGVDAEGLLDPDALAAAIDGRTALVCCMLVNNETGVIQDLPAVAGHCRRHGALLFCDLTQALGRLPLDLGALGCDLAACSAHKAYGPKGVGALWLRRGLGITPLLHGGGQERGLRSGTENTPGIAAFGLAARLAHERLEATRSHLAGLSALLEELLRVGDPRIRIHGAGAPRAPGITQSTRPGCARGLLAQLHGICAASGSSCAGAGDRPSRVLTAMGVAEAEAGNAIRISVGRATTADEVRLVAERILAGIARLSGD